MYKTLDTPSKQRITWIDATKAILFICVVIGHSTSSQILHGVIYTFHIPLFIILSGFTMKDPKTSEDIYKIFLKSFTSLYLPMVITYAIESCFLLLGTDSMSLGNYFSLFFSKVLNSVGIVWFFCALFYARVLYAFLIFLKLEKPHYICLIASISYFVFLFFPTFHLQNLDTVPIFIALLYLGRLLKKYEKYLSMDFPLLSIISFCIVFCFADKIQLDVGLRWYSGGFYVFLVPLCAMYFVLTFCIQINNIPFVQKIASFTGQNTVLLVCIHHLDHFFISEKSFSESPLNILYIFVRLFFIFILFFLIKGCHFFLKKIIKSDSNKLSVQ